MYWGGSRRRRRGRSVSAAACRRGTRLPAPVRASPPGSHVRRASPSGWRSRCGRRRVRGRGRLRAGVPRSWYSRIGTGPVWASSRPAGSRCGPRSVRLPLWPARRPSLAGGLPGRRRRGLARVVAGSGRIDHDDDRDRHHDQRADRDEAAGGSPGRGAAPGRGMVVGTLLRQAFVVLPVTRHPRRDHGTEEPMTARSDDQRIQAYQALADAYPELAAVAAARPIPSTWSAARCATCCWDAGGRHRPGRRGRSGGAGDGARRRAAGRARAVRDAEGAPRRRGDRHRRGARETYRSRGRCRSSARRPDPDRSGPPRLHRQRDGRAARQAEGTDRPLDGQADLERGCCG